MEAQGSQSVAAGRGLHINQLPAEMLTIILGNLTMEEDLNSAHNVCKLWLELIDSQIGFPVRLSSQFWFERNGRRGIRRGMDILPCIGTREIRILMNDIVLLPCPDAPPTPLLKTPEMLKTLVIELWIERPLFRLLTGEKTTTLSELELSSVALHLLQRADVENFPFADSLQKLKFSRHWIDDPQLSLNVRPILNALLTGNRFRKLTLFKYEFPLDNAVTFMATNVVIDFILRHPSLERLLIKSQMHGNELTMNEEDRRALTRRIRGRRVWLSVVDLNITTVGGTEDEHRQQLSLWSELIRAVVGIETLRLKMDSLLITPALITRIVQRNGDTLKVLYVDRMESSVNLQLFGPATSLTELTIGSAPDFRGAAHLPHTLTRLELGGGILATEFRHLLFGLPSLTQLGLELKHLPAAANRQPYQLSLDTLREFIQSPQRILKKVTITGTSVCSWPGDLHFRVEAPLMEQ